MINSQGFFGLQKSAIEIIQHSAPKNKFLEDYLSIFPDLENIEEDAFKVRYKETLQPLITCLPAGRRLLGTMGLGDN